MFIEISKNLKKLSKYFPENLYVVGGYVRNQILKIKSSDVDLASSVGVEEVVLRLENSEFKTKIKNLKTGSLLICCGNESFEYTAFRKEVYPKGGSHNPIEVLPTNNIEDDAQRRDFSINSVYFNINKDEIFDHFHGIVDIKQKIIRCNVEPDKVFSSDGERILRMVRFAGELNFGIETQTFRSAKKNVLNIKDLSGTRRYAEILKILYADKKYGLNQKAEKIALRLLNSLGVWQAFGLNKTIKINMALKTENRFLGLLIDIVDTQKPECLEAFLTKLLTSEFGFSVDESQRIFMILAGYYEALFKKRNKSFFFKYFEFWSEISSLLEKKSKRVRSRYQFFYDYILEHNLAIKPEDLKIKEKDIKENFPGIDKRDYVKILRSLLNKVFEGKIKNEKEILISEIQKKYKK